MKITAHNDRQVVVTHTRTGLLVAIAAAALFTLVSVVLDAKHPIFWIKCTRHSADNAVKEDIDCAMTVRPERALLDFRLHEELYYNFELRAVEMTTRGECTSLADDEAESLKHHSHLRQHNAGQCRYIINLLDEKGAKHVIKDLETAQEATRVYNKLTSFLQKTKTTAKQMTLSVEHDTSFSDEAALCVGLVLLAWLVLVPLHEEMVLDRDSGVLIRRRTNLLRCVCSEAVVSLENVVGAEVVSMDIFFVSPVAQRQGGGGGGGGGDSTLSPQRVLKEYELRINTNCVPQYQGRGSTMWNFCHCLWDSNAINQAVSQSQPTQYLDLGMGARFSDDANLRRVVEAINTVLLAYGRTPTDLKIDAQPSPRDESIPQEDTQCVVCLSRTARIVLLPCRHVPCCGPCSDRLTTCPLCRTKITASIAAIL